MKANFEGLSNKCRFCTVLYYHLTHKVCFVLTLKVKVKWPIKCLETHSQLQHTFLSFPYFYCWKQLNTNRHERESSFFVLFSNAILAFSDMYVCIYTTINSCVNTFKKLYTLCCTVLINKSANVVIFAIILYVLMIIHFF